MCALVTKIEELKNPELRNLFNEWSEAVERLRKMSIDDSAYQENLREVRTKQNEFVQFCNTHSRGESA